MGSNAQNGKNIIDVKSYVTSQALLVKFSGEIFHEILENHGKSNLWSDELSQVSIFV